MGKKASENFKVYQNENGPKISTVSRSVIEEDGKYFKDIDGSGKVSEVNDWRLPARKRAKAYVKTLSVKEKIAQLFISDWRMGKYPHVAAEKNEDGTGGPVLDESGTLDEAEFHGKTIFGEQHLPGTSTLIKEWFSRHLILRANPPEEDLTDFLNQLQKVAEECEHFIPGDPAEADYAVLMVSPSSGAYFSATPGFLELDICDGKVVHDVDDEGRPKAETHSETTLAEAGRIAEIAEAVHRNQGKVIINVNFTLAWQLGNVEPCADALTAGFNTYQPALLDVIFGRFAPTGKLPFTLPKNDDVLKVDENGVCISPNDVPGYDKDKYMPDEMKDENGKAYAYRDAAGNYYEMDFGLRYDE